MTTDFILKLIFVLRLSFFFVEIVYAMYVILIRVVEPFEECLP
jgi:uncharacterized membrane protein YqaE (UPF0057 family)